MFDGAGDFTQYKLISYDDEASGGGSECEIVDSLGYENITYQYVLEGGRQFPFAGVMLFQNDSSIIDLSEYDHCSIMIRAEKGKHIPFYLFTAIDSFSTWNDVNTFYNLLYTLKLEKGWNEIDVDMYGYEIPDWWYNKHDLTADDLPEPEFGKTTCLNFANCNILDKGIQDSVMISRIEFYADMFWVYFSAVFFIALYYSVWWLIERKKKNAVVVEEEKLQAEEPPVPPAPVFTYSKIEVEDYKSKEETAVFDYINANYSTAELTIIDVQSATGISERKISNLIKQKTELNFKQFLNKLRITEAKRLLKESDLQISEIAFKIGYGNVSHFNRVFKQEEGVSPGNFRKASESTN